MGMTQVITSQGQKPYEITNLAKNVKNTQNCDECLMYRLFLLIETYYHEI